MQETLANRNALLEKFLAMQQQQQQARFQTSSPDWIITIVELVYWCLLPFCSADSTLKSQRDSWYSPSVCQKLMHHDTRPRI